MIVSTVTVNGNSPKVLLQAAAPEALLMEVLFDWSVYARQIATRHVRETLGQSGLYTQQPAYAARKVSNPFVYQPDKMIAPTAPLILSGGLYKSLFVGVEGGFGDLTFQLKYGSPGSVNYDAVRYQQSPNGAWSKGGGRSRIYKSRKAQIERINVYGEHWENVTHFFEQGIESAVPELETMLVQLIDHMFTGMLNGGVYQRLELAVLQATYDRSE